MRNSQRRALIDEITAVTVAVALVSALFMVTLTIIYRAMELF